MKEKISHDEEYLHKCSDLIHCKDREDYRSKFEQRIQPFYLGGTTKGYVRGLAVKSLLDAVDKSQNEKASIKVIDAGSGLGELGVYLAILGFQVIGVELSTSGVAGSRKLADKFKLVNCRFIETSLENIPVDDASVDFIIGHASLHHFIKYTTIPSEFKRVMKPGAMAFFADAFGENKLYHLFHDKKKMEHLGDVSLTKPMIESFFKDFKVVLHPTDWFVMFDKLFLKVLPGTVVRKLSKYFFILDRKINSKKRGNLRLSGSILTIVEKRQD